MRILMLGWEFPPFIAGGLGTACYGLTRALDQRGHEIVFVLPKPVRQAGLMPVGVADPAPMGVGASEASGASGAATPSRDDMPNVRFHEIPARFSSPYASGGPGGRVDGGRAEGGSTIRVPVGGAESGSGHAPAATNSAGPSASAAGASEAFSETSYTSHDLIGETERYLRLVVSMARTERFDIIHAHDWLTYPAAAALAAISRKPLVVHVHSTEFDRAGAEMNQRIYDIEKAGMEAADRVIAVSQFTKSVIVHRYGIAPSKVDVVYNGIDRDEERPKVLPHRSPDGDKYVLFLGRITAQKGPEYFIHAAKRVAERLPDVKFVLAGSGDLAMRMIDLAAGLGIGDRVLFTGFLRGEDVDRVFAMADCYVMPSVSEPFGIAALEAMSHDVPVILSKTSGASEVLKHVLKVDFWDTEEMASRIIAVLTRPALAETLREHGPAELARLTWSQAAESCEGVYDRAGAAALV